MEAKETTAEWVEHGTVILSNVCATEIEQAGFGTVCCVYDMEGESVYRILQAVNTHNDLLGIVERILYSVNGLSATLAATNKDYAISTLRKETAEVIRLSQLAIAKVKGGV